MNEISETSSSSDRPVRPSIAELFDRLGEKLRTHPARTAGMNAVYQFNLTGPRAVSYVLEIRAGHAEIHEREGGAVGGAEGASVTVTVDAEEFIDMNLGLLDGPELFISGRMKVVGDPVLGMRLPIFFA